LPEVDLTFELKHELELDF